MSAHEGSAGPEQNEIEARAALLYSEAGRVASAFWDWRHKVILICSGALGLVFAITSWMYKQKLGGGAMSIPLFVGGVVALMCRGIRWKKWSDPRRLLRHR